MINVLLSQRASACSPGELSLLRFSSTKYPGNESYKATMPYMNWNNTTSWFIVPIFSYFDRAFFLQDLTKLDNLQQWLTPIMTKVSPPLFGTLGPRGLCWTGGELSKNSMQDQISRYTGLHSITIMWLDVRQSSAEWCRGLKRFTTMTTGPSLSVQIKTGVLSDEKPIQTDSIILVSYLLFRNKAAHKLRFLTELKMWENTKISHKQVPNLSLIRLAICQRYQNFSLSITLGGPVWPRGCQCCDVLSPPVPSSDWLTHTGDCYHSLPCQPSSIWSFI